MITVDSTGIKVTNRGEMDAGKVGSPSRLDQGPSGSECGDQRDS